MNKAQITKLIRHTQENPDFFHKLVFEPEKAVNEIEEISVLTKQAILNTTPTSFFRKLLEYDEDDNTENINYPMICETTCDSTLLYVNQVWTDPALVLTSPYIESRRRKDCAKTCPCTASYTCPGSTCRVTNL